MLSGNNTYGGVPSSQGFYLTQTVVNGGELRVNGQTGTNSGTGGSTVVVNAGGTLSGSGQIIPAQQVEALNTVTINGGAIIAPGPGGPGKLTVGATTTPGVTTATVNQVAGSFFRFLYSNGANLTPAAVDTGASNVAGSATGNNELVVNGGLNLEPNALWQILGNASDFAAGQSYSFLEETATTVNGTNTTDSYNIDYITNPAAFDVSQFANFTPGSMDIQVHNVGNNVYLNITSVPEPGTLAATGAAALGLIGAIRRRRKAAKVG